MAQLTVAHLRLNDRVDETQSEWVLLHLHRVQVVEGELGNALDDDGEVATEERFRRFKIDLLVNLRGREDIVADGDVLHEDRLQFGGVGTQNLILLESL